MRSGDAGLDDWRNRNICLKFDPAPERARVAHHDYRPGEWPGEVPKIDVRKDVARCKWLPDWGLVVDVRLLKYLIGIGFAPPVTI